MSELHPHRQCVVVKPGEAKMTQNLPDAERDHLLVELCKRLSRRVNGLITLLTKLKLSTFEQYPARSRPGT